MTKRVGITGGIGSGKSLCCEVFRVLGVPVFDADAAAKTLYGDPDVRQEVSALLGEKAFLADGAPDKQAIASMVFSNNELLDGLNQILHPRVANVFDEWVGRQDALYVLKEAAILIESGAGDGLDAIIVVNAPAKVRLQRVMDRDKLPAEEVQARIARQMADADRLKFADHVIENDGTKPLLAQIIKIHEDIIS